MTPSSAEVSEQKIALLDDDPTGVQTLAGINALLDWDPSNVANNLGRSSAIYVLTNSRALTPEDARRTAGAVAAAVRASAPTAAMVLRGDSTLRGHLLDEYLGVCEGQSGRKLPTLLLAPALPSAGRVTVAGTQLLERNGVRIPVHETEFAKDGIFSYSTSRLVDWASERSNGLFSTNDGIEIPLDAIHSDGPEMVTKALLDAEATNAPTVVVADSETTDDVEVVIAGYRRALQAGANIVLRCGPAGAGALFNATATQLAQPPSATGGVLIICGSYVTQSSRQLEALEARYPGSSITVDVSAIANGNQTDSARVVRSAQSLLDETGLAVVTTPRSRPQDLRDLDSGMKVARGMADLLRQIDRPHAVTVTKGGITSAVSVRSGLGASAAEVVGPVLPGVSMWQVTDDHGQPRTMLIVPGNVGDDSLLVRVVDLIRGHVE